VLVDSNPVLMRQGALPSAAVGVVRVVIEEATEHDGVEPVGEQTLLNLDRGDADVVHLTCPAGYAQGYLIHSRSGAQPALIAELVVSPRARRRGIGTTLLRILRRAAAGLGAHEVHVWAHGNLPAAQGLARRAGMRAARELWQMGADLTTDRPELADLPDGVVVRGFRPGQDDAAWLDLNARAFAEHPDQGRLTEADLADRIAQPWFRADDLLLAEGQRLLGFAWLKVVDEVGELYVLGVDPDAHGAGLGRALASRALEHLRARGVSRAVLFVDASSPAVRLYQGLGFVRTRQDVQYVLDVGR
jgi:mycothiol synthase